MHDSTPSPSEPADPPFNILVVDDDPLNREVFELLLRHHGFTVRLACDGQEAVEAATELLPSIVLMDLRMPRMDGYRAAEALHQMRGDIPIIAVTAGPATREELEPRGFQGLLRKPVPGSALVEAVRRIVRGAGTAGWITAPARRARN